MNRRAAGAALCAAAAIALLLAAVLPWWRVVDHDGGVGARAHFTLLGGEQCVAEGKTACVSLSMAGKPGARDDLFAWGGRATLALALVTAGLALAMAFLGGRPRRALRATVATFALATAAASALVVSIERIPMAFGIPTLASGLWLALLGAALAAAGAAWPVAVGDARNAGKRYGLAGAIVGLVIVAWATLALRVWWTGDAEFGTRSRSPLGYELCDLGTCARYGNGAASVRSYLALALVSATAAVMLAAALGAAVRIARGTAPGGWGLTSLIATGAALVSMIIALVVVPGGESHLAIGVPLYGVAALGLGVAVVLGRRWIRAVDAGDELAPTARFGQVPSGPRPVLAPLGVTSPGPAPQSWAPAAVTTSPYAPPFAAPAPPAIPAYAPALSPAPPRPVLQPLRPPTAPMMAPRPSPYCPTCRQPTLWHSKRGAWYCSACKRTV